MNRHGVPLSRKTTTHCEVPKNERRKESKQQCKISIKQELWVARGSLKTSNERNSQKYLITTRTMAKSAQWEMGWRDCRVGWSKFSGCAGWKKCCWQALRSFHEKLSYGIWGLNTKNSFRHHFAWMIAMKPMDRRHPGKQKFLLGRDCLLDPLSDRVLYYCFLEFAVCSKMHSINLWIFA